MSSQNTSAQSAASQPAPAKRGCAPWLVALIIILVGLGILILFIMAQMKPPPAVITERSWQTELTPVKLVKTQPTIQLFGMVEAPELITERTAYPADIAEVLAREGSRFQKGDVLVRLDDTELQLALVQRRTDLDLLAVRHASNQAALAEEKSLLAITKRELERQQTLSKRGAISGAQLEQTRSTVGRQQLQVAQRQLAVDEFEARRMQAQAALKQAELDVARATITAPFAGVVASLPVAPGDRLQPGQPIIAYYQPSQLEVRATIPDQRLPAIQADNLPLPTTASFGQQTVALELTRLAGQTASSSGGIDGFFQPAGNNAALLTPGQVLTLQLTLPAQNNVAVIPPDALYELKRVYIAKKLTGDDVPAMARRPDDADSNASPAVPITPKTYYRMQAVDVDVIGERSTINSRGNPSNNMLVRSDNLQTGDLLVTTQLPNAVTGLLITALPTADQQSTAE